MSLLLSTQGGGRAGKPLIRALHLGSADTGWTAATSWPKRHHHNDPAGKIKPATKMGLRTEAEHRVACGLGCRWGVSPTSDLLCQLPGLPKASLAL